MTITQCILIHTFKVLLFTKETCSLYFDNSIEINGKLHNVFNSTLFILNCCIKMSIKRSSQY